MELEQLLDTVDNVINASYNEGKSLSAFEVVRQCDVHEKYQPLVEQYVSEVHGLFSEFDSTLAENNHSLFFYAGLKGAVFSPLLGAAVGGVGGYLLGGPKAAGYFAGIGAAVGFVAERVFHPLTFFFAKRYTSPFVEQREASREEYRNQTLLQLEGL